MERKQKKIEILIIYDIIDNKKRNKLAAHLCGYGFRIQKSAFEASLNLLQYKRLVKELEHYADKEDSIIIYKISNAHKVQLGSCHKNICFEDVIVV